MSTGLQLKLDGLRAVEGLNGAALAQLRDHAVAVARTHGDVSADDLRTWAEAQRITLSSPNAWGAVFRDPRFTRINMIRSAFPTNHARFISSYALTNLEEYDETN